MARRRGNDRATLDAALGEALVAVRLDDTATLRRLVPDLRLAVGLAEGQAVFDGHQYLGLVALADGDLPVARAELLAAGQSRGSPVLASFGPELAPRRGAARSRREPVVLTFLDDVARISAMHPDRVRGWQAAIRKGQSPELSRQ